MDLLRRRGDAKMMMADNIVATAQNAGFVYDWFG